MVDHDEEVVRVVLGDCVAPDDAAPRDALLGAHRRIVGAAHGWLCLRRMWVWARYIGP